MSGGKYFLNIQDETKWKVDRQRVKVRKFGRKIENEGILTSIKYLASDTRRGRGIHLTRDIVFNVPVPNGRGSVIMYPAMINLRPTLVKVLLPNGRSPGVTILLYQSQPLGFYIEIPP